MQVRARAHGPVPVLPAPNPPTTPTTDPTTDPSTRPTALQVCAERQVLVSLLAAVLGAAADEVLAPAATPFATHVSRHFAMLFVAGVTPPPPAPVMARTQPPAHAPAQEAGGEGEVRRGRSVRSVSARTECPRVAPRCLPGSGVA
jgi:hypothetical protein